PAMNGSAHTPLARDGIADGQPAIQNQRSGIIRILVAMASGNTGSIRGETKDPRVVGRARVQPAKFIEYVEPGYVDLIILGVAFGILTRRRRIGAGGIARHVHVEPTIRDLGIAAVSGLEDAEIPSVLEAVNLLKTPCFPDAAAFGIVSGTTDGMAGGRRIGSERAVQARTIRGFRARQSGVRIDVMSSGWSPARQLALATIVQRKVEGDLGGTSAAAMSGRVIAIDRIVIYGFIIHPDGTAGLQTEDRSLAAPVTGIADTKGGAGVAGSDGIFKIKVLLQRHRSETIADVAAIGNFSPGRRGGHRGLPA